ncbi:hypothetical protein ACR56S_03705 [Staphylococcus hominis]|uniref:hypothetical protein n=1 Tax=Staphylococcus hominis TaxID=1290 RepID=UPI003DA1624D
MTMELKEKELFEKAIARLKTELSTKTIIYLTQGYQFNISLKDNEVNNKETTISLQLELDKTEVGSIDIEFLEDKSVIKSVFNTNNQSVSPNDNNRSENCKPLVDDELLEYITSYESSSLDVHAFSLEMKIQFEIADLIKNQIKNIAQVIYFQKYKPKQDNILDLYKIKGLAYYENN